MIQHITLSTLTGQCRTLALVCNGIALHPTVSMVPVYGRRVAGRWTVTHVRTGRRIGEACGYKRADAVLIFDAAREVEHNGKRLGDMDLQEARGVPASCLEHLSTILAATSRMRTT